MRAGSAEIKQARAGLAGKTQECAQTWKEESTWVRARSEKSEKERSGQEGVRLCKQLRRGVIYGIIDIGKPAAPALRERRRINGGDMSENIIEVSGLEKSYASVKAVQGIGFTVEKGSLFSFLGVNGAGKSTTINILCSILEKDGGTVRIGGFDLDRERQKIKPLLGVVFQNTVLDDLLTVRDNLTVRASFYGLKGRRGESGWKS